MSYSDRYYGEKKSFGMSLRIVVHFTLTVVEGPTNRACYS